MRAAARLLLALPAAGVALDAALWHLPRYVAGAALLACLLVLARRGWDWCRARPADCPLVQVLAAMAAGAPFLFLLAVAGLAR